MLIFRLPPAHSPGLLPSVEQSTEFRYQPWRDSKLLKTFGVGFEFQILGKLSSSVDEQWHMVFVCYVDNSGITGGVDFDASTSDAAKVHVEASAMEAATVQSSGCSSPFH